MSLPRLSFAAVLTLTLAVPATASAAQTIGSPLDGSRGTVDAVGCSSPCTLVQDTIDGLQVHADGGVITRWKAVVGSGSTATLRVVSRQGSGAYTALASGHRITGNDQIQTVTDHVVIPANATIGLDVDGVVGGIRTGGRVASFEPVLADGASASSVLTDDELLLQATVEPDLDSDGLGDETEDACVFCASTGGGGGGGSSSSSSDDRGDHFTIGPKALLVPGRKPVLRAYASNGLDDVEGRLALKVGGKVVATKRVFVTSGAQNEVDFPLGRRVAKALAKRVSTAVVTGNPAVKGPASAAVTQKVAIVRGGSRAYDGTYRGSGPLVIVVDNGIVVSASKPLLVSSTRGSASLTRTFFLPEDGPVVVDRRGKVDVRGDWKADTVAFKARFRRNGTVKGYLSLWHTELGFGSDGSFQTDQYMGASNWTAHR